jgi:hypothetical protein
MLFLALFDRGRETPATSLRPFYGPNRNQVTFSARNHKDQFMRAKPGLLAVLAQLTDHALSTLGQSVVNADQGQQNSGC